MSIRTADGPDFGIRQPKSMDTGVPFPRYRVSMDRVFDAFTMGFSNRTWEQTIGLLRGHSIQCLVDIRTLPGSRRTPQFNLENLEARLPECGIEYVHMKALGGLRKPVEDSATNAAWRNDGFRGYADYMQSHQFEEAIEALIEFVRKKRTVYACTEAVFWKCHRQLVSDALSVRGYRVGHILSATRVEAHELTSFARVEGLQVRYPALL